ncbi:hypothetical protein NOLU111490_01155 [Novosphingobium lubricantis]
MLMSPPRASPPATRHALWHKPLAPPKASTLKVRPPVAAIRLPPSSKLATIVPPWALPPEPPGPAPNEVPASAPLPPNARALKLPLSRANAPLPVPFVRAVNRVIEPPSAAPPSPPAPSPPLPKKPRPPSPPTASAWTSSRLVEIVPPSAAATRMTDPPCAAPPVPPGSLLNKPETNAELAPVPPRPVALTARVGVSMMPLPSAVALEAIVMVPPIPTPPADCTRPRPACPSAKTDIPIGDVMVDPARSMATAPPEPVPAPLPSPAKPLASNVTSKFAENSTELSDVTKLIVPPVPLPPLPSKNELAPDPTAPI